MQDMTKNSLINKLNYLTIPNITQQTLPEIFRTSTNKVYSMSVVRSNVTFKEFTEKNLLKVKYSRETSQQHKETTRRNHLLIKITSKMRNAAYIQGGPKTTNHLSKNDAK